MQLNDTDLQQLKALLLTIHISLEELDTFIAETPHIYRSIRGHAFEVWFDREMAERGIAVSKVGGDDVVDRVLNGHTLQLKTPFRNGTKEGVLVSYKMHKTHGAEIKPFCFYKKEEFADFFVGMHPSSGVIICPRAALKTRSDVNPRLDYGEYISDPLPFDWQTEWLNRYDLLGIEVKNPPLPSDHSSSEVRLFPKLIEKIGFTDYDIVKSLLDEANFRTWFQLIVGTIREFHFEKFAQQNGLKLIPIEGFGGRGNQKLDYLTDSGIKIQVKGLTKGMARGGLLGCETQCSHGRIPTRLYKRSDFDYAVIVVDPNSIHPEVAAAKGIDHTKYNFCIVDIDNLPLHPRSSEWGQEYIKSSYLFNPADVEWNNAALLKVKVRNQ